MIVPSLFVRKWRVDRWLVAVGVLLVLAVALSAAALIVNLKQRVIAGKLRELSNMTLLLSQETERAFQALEAVQTSVIDRMQSEGIDSPAKFDQKTRRATVYGMLHDKAENLPYVGALALINSDGELVNFSRYWPVPAVSVADRDYFQVLSMAPGMGRYLSMPVESRGRGTWTTYLARQFETLDGKLIGLVLGAMRLEFFEQFYKTIQVGPGGAIGLFRDDGVLLARNPHVPGGVGHTYFMPMTASGLLPGGDGVLTLHRASPVDHIERLLAIRHITGYPVVVAVSVTVDSLAASWHPEATIIGVAAVMLCLVLCACVVLGRRQILAQYRLAASANHMARHDMLTGLPNRMMFAEALRAHSEAAGGDPEPASILLVDLDYFKTVNDTLGHSAGDELLRVIAGRLRKSVRNGDLVVRLGGDEFAVLQKGGDREAATVLAQRIVDVVAEACSVGGNQIVAGASVGVTFFPADGLDASQLLKNADLALYRAKADGRGSWRTFEPQMEEQVQARRTLEMALRDALLNDGFELHYQPVVDAYSARLRGFEALLRWKNANAGSPNPAQFIAVAEETGLIVPIGKWVLERACRQAMDWPEAVRVSVNVSGHQFRSRALIEQVERALRLSGLPANRLEIEITESVLLQDSPQLRSTLEQLRMMGVSIALDDFGTGYSSLSYLRQFPADRIKIDISFVADIVDDAESARIVMSIIDLARSLGMSTTAEGVETSAQWEQLRVSGCGEIQGYYVGRPGTAAQALEFLEKYGDASLMIY